LNPGLHFILNSGMKASLIPHCRIMRALTPKPSNPYGE
jgi:hypothetical protein